MTHARGFRFLATVAMIALLALPGSAALAGALTQDAATRYVTDMGNRAVSVLAAQGDTRIRQSEFARLMVEAVDFEAVAMATLGRAARSISEQEKQEFTQLFAAHVIDAAIKRFGDVQIVGFQVGEGRPQPNGDIKVQAVIERAGGEPLAIDWRVRLSGGSPRIGDIEFAGYSLIIHYRGEFERSREVSVPALIGRLRDLNRNSLALNTVRRELR